MTRPVVTSGRLTMSPSAPSPSCLHRRTTVRLKLGSTSCGIDRSSDGASDEDDEASDDDTLVDLQPFTIIRGQRARMALT
jgi:hypothetical protein